MRPSLRPLTCLALAASVSTTACSGGGSSTPAAPIPSLHKPSNAKPAQSTGFGYDSTFVQAAQLVGPASFGRLGIDVVLAMRDARGLTTFAQAVSDPKSASYRRFLTPEQIADRFGASVSDQTAAIAYFHRFGIWCSGWKQRMLLHVAGSQSQLESAFHTKFGTYRSAQGETFIAPMSAPSVDAGVPVVGSANIVMRTKLFTRQFVSSKGNGSGYSPLQVAAAFDYTGAYAAGYTGSGITIGIVGTGPIVTQTSTTVGDANAYKQYYNVGGSSTVTEVATTGSDPVINANSGFASPPPVTGPCSTAGNSAFDSDPSESPSSNPPCNPEDGEAQLDTEQTASLAKDSSVQFYLAYNPNDGCSAGIGTPCPAGAGFPAQGLLETDEELQTVIDHNTADVVSLSFGGPEAGEVGQPSPPFEFTSNGGGLDPMEFAMMVSLGMSVFVSSGDQGAESCTPGIAPGLVNSVCVEYPASDPSVAGVGGVTAPLNNAGQIAGPITAWGVSTGGGVGGSGGGVSAYFPLPSYQSGGLPGIVGSTRNVPDLSLVGDPQTGVAVLEYADPSFGGPVLGDIGGTSVAAPESAAMWALVLQACKQTVSCAKAGGTYPYRLGNPDPLLYGIYQKAATYGTTFLPVLYGSNAQANYCYYNAASDPADCPTPGPGATPTPQPSVPPLDPGYSANPTGGYNQVTGLGVPFARALIRAVVGV